MKSFTLYNALWLLAWTLHEEEYCAIHEDLNQPVRPKSSELCALVQGKLQTYQVLQLYSAAPGSSKNQKQKSFIVGKNSATESWRGHVFKEISNM